MPFVQPFLPAATVILAFLISVSPLSSYGLQFSAFTVLVYIAISFLVRRSIVSVNTKVTVDVLVFSFATSLLLFTTGGFTSPLFFLSYFLLFGVSLLSSPTTSTVIAITFMLLFVISPKTEFWSEVLQAASLLAIAPISVLFGKQYLKILEDQRAISTLSGRVQKNKIDVTSWTEGDFRKRLLRIQEYLQKLIADPKIGEEEKLRISSLYRQIYDLFLSGKGLEKDVEK